MTLQSSLRLGLRKVALAALRRFNPGDISIRHHYTGERFRLHSFMHKGYWYYGKRREQDTMELFGRLLRPGDSVIEIGGHIGYISLYFASLVGDSGRVLVFEPGPNNLPYTRANLAGKGNVRLIENAVADFAGKASFYIESYTGQNNSLLSDYARFDENLRGAGLATAVKKSVVEVDCVTLDDYLARSGDPVPALIKIDVEGAELTVLKGMQQTLRSPGVALMVEVTEQAAEVFQLLRAAGFMPFSSSGLAIRGAENPRDNTFWLKEGDRRLSLFRPA
jgi:FkbM family methyltransferase